jgi:protein-tyrosine-phosphatase/predicted ATP-grasp superfamily ATP-dependent carboligase
VSFRHLSTGGRALVLGDDTRSFLATVRGLGRRFIEVHAAPRNFRAPALRSRYIRTVHRLPAWCGDGADWLDAMEAILRGQPFDVVIPCNETALLPLQRHRARFETLTRLAIPHDEAVEILFDKDATRNLARKLRVPVAPGRLLRETDQPRALIAEFGTPLVVKPRHSYQLESLHRRGKVRIVHGAEDLAPLLRNPELEETVIEGFFRGSGLGVSVLAQDGVVVQTFEHHRVREADGASYYRVSAPPDPSLAAACIAIVAALRFSGLAMFEFKRGPDRSWVLLEVNARPWGSMPLPLALGVEFAYRWYRQIMEGTTTPAVAYRTPVYGRNLIPDLRAMATEAGEQPGFARRLGYLARQLWDMRRVFSGREVQDVLVADDPRPAAAEMGQLIGEAWNRVVANLPLHGRFAAFRARRLVRAAWPRGGPVLFVCQGNICRSPFAAASLRRLLADPSRTGSAGMLPLPGRTPPALALAAAARRGIDLSAHRSQLLTQDMAEHASLLLVFDLINRGAVLDQFPHLATPIVRLGDFTFAGDIADPVDGDAAIFEHMCAQIEQAVVTIRHLLD